MPVSRFLKQKGFSSQNLVQLKKDPSAVLANGIPCFMNHILQPGDTLTLHIRENHSSEKIPPVNLPLNIVYEDADLMVINKPAGMPIHPSMNNYYNSLANASRTILNSRTVLSSSAASTAWTGILPD